MLSFIKKIFYRKECYKCTTILDMISCISTRLKVDPYSNLYRHKVMDSIHNNIYESIDDLTMLFNTLELKQYKIRNVKLNDNIKVTMGSWFTDNDKNIIVDTDGVLEEYLKVSKSIVEWYNYNNNINSELYGVSNKIKPYIISIEIVLNTIIENQDQEL